MHYTPNISSTYFQSQEFIEVIRKRIHSGFPILSEILLQFFLNESIEKCLFFQAFFQKS